MKIRTLIAGAAVMLLCGGLGVCVAQEAPSAPAPAAAPEAAPAAAPEAAPASAAKPKHYRKHHHRHHHAGKYHGGQKEFSEQELQQMSATPPSK